MTDDSRPLKQTPCPGKRLVMFRGDTLTFTLTLPGKADGEAWLRTGIGHARIARQETIREICCSESPLGRNWSDIPMKQTAPDRFEVTLPLCEVGHFEAKACFLDAGSLQPRWPEGPNTIINVEPAHTCCGNIIYNAFVRQFGPNKSGKRIPEPQTADCISSLDHAGYTVIPESGKFRNLVKELDFITEELGCCWIQLLPVHPIPTTYARMGRFGSPYAALGFTAVDPGLAEFDPKATPLEQFTELVDAVHARGARLILDIAINHTGWAARIHETHPEWLCRDAEGHIEMPGAWGVTWADLTKLDYSRRELWPHMAKVFITWCRRGVDGFRCDAGYMIPVPAWKYIVAEVREQYPDTVFFLEGLGGPVSVTRDLLGTANLNWAYSELFQNYDRGQLEHYLPEAFDIAEADGLMVHFAETHDNNRLAAISPLWAKMRITLCALFSQNGGFAFANGVEWLATEKINVHESPSLNWGATENLVDHIRRLTDLLKHHPAFSDQTELKMIQKGGGNGIVLRRRHRPTGKTLLVLANLFHETAAELSWRREDMPQSLFTDLISGKAFSVKPSGDMMTCTLEPCAVLFISPDPEDMLLPDTKAGPPERAVFQKLRAKALDVFVHYYGTGNTGDFDPDKAARKLSENPLEYCRSINPSGDAPNVIRWQWPEDLRREVMVPPGHFLLVCADRPFRARISDMADDRTFAVEESLTGDDGSCFALFMPLEIPDIHLKRRLEISVFNNGQGKHGSSPLLYLCAPDNARVQQVFRRKDILEKPLRFLATNGRGGMLRAGISWGMLESRYDALLAANLHPKFPEDRWIMLSRCRAWVVYQGYSREISGDCLDSFHVDEQGRGLWNYHIPAGQGDDIFLTITAAMQTGENAVSLEFFRCPCKSGSRSLGDEKPVRLILRPDIEDRNFHQTTKAYAGPERWWPGVIRAEADAFTFSPGTDRHLRLELPGGEFVPEPEWQYMVHRPLEAERGLDPHSDLFSPGWFGASLEGGTSVILSARIQDEISEYHPEKTVKSPEIPATFCDMEPAMIRAMDAFVVRRDHLNTVIAGYPWFLDWGRDTLIFVRGLIAAGRLDASRAILGQFARFEENGTLPNMIRGNDAGNRDTSDAPLWFFAGCADLLAAEKSERFLDEDCGGRTIRQVLVSIARSIMAGTPNGIRMDSGSGLLFSPSHFTWMDTNFPAGTPREGYPVEIQALWYAALSLLSQTDRAEPLWADLAGQVKNSLKEMFYLEKAGYLADCLNARPGQSARDAVPDDALRPNQLFALTLGAVTDADICRKVLAACETLLVPGAIRSLADRPVSVALEIRRHGQLLNDPRRPYQGIYAGDEDTRRKPAYHNGTAWTWVFPSYAEAYALCYGDAARDTARAWLGSASEIINNGCIGQVPEILDGDFPHAARGCDAQAWGASELLRVWRRLSP